jgi:hypothetical protein
VYGPNALVTSLMGLIAMGFQARNIRETR